MRPVRSIAPADRLAVESEAVGLVINVSKTKIMRSPAAPPMVLNIGDRLVEEVDSFTYLVTNITRTGGSLE